MAYLNYKDFIKRIKLFFLCFNDDKKFLKFLNGKTIAIVGNADSIFNTQSKLGAEIDSHDVVIRFNKGYILKEEYQGNKTTVWASSLYIEEDELKENFFDIKYIFWLTPKMSQIKTYTKNMYSKMCIYPINAWYSLYKKLNRKRPTSGAMLIDYLCKNAKYKSMDIYGFDFFKTNSFYNTKELSALKKNSPHNFEGEKAYISSVIKKHNNVKLIESN